MSPYWKDKVYKALLRLNSIVSYFLRLLLMIVVITVCFPTFVIIGIVVFIGMVIIDFQETTKEKLEVWAYGKDKIIHK